MKYTQIPTNTFETIQLNAGILATGFNPATGEVTGLLGATTGGVSDTPEYLDYGEDIDNCPKNMKELKKIDTREVKISGTFVTVTAESGAKLAGSADVDPLDSNHIIPRNDILQTDFQDVWWIGDYSNVNTGANAGFIAVHLLNALNTAGFAIQSTDKGKGQFAFEFTGHYSMDAQDTVPYELWIKAGNAVVTPSVNLNKHATSLAVDATETLTAVTVPAGETVTWSSSDSTKAEVTSGGVVTGKAQGNAIITASITKDGVTYTDTCTVVVVAGA